MRTLTSLFLILTTLSVFAEGPAWWDAKWPTRKKITLDTTDKGLAITDPIGTSAILIRLHDGNFGFQSAKEDGSDLRLLADDQKTVLKHHVEKWDSLLNEAYVWVQVPDVKPTAETTVWLYYGNVTDAANVADEKGTYDAETISVYHFGETTSAAKDSSASAVSLEGTTAAGAGVAAGGQRLFGQTPITVPDNPATVWAAGSALTWSAWIKATELQPNAIVFTRENAGNAFIVGVDNGIPYVEINKQRSSAGEPIAVAVWNHLAVVVDAGTATVFVNGKSYGTLASALPGFSGPALIGKGSAASSIGFVGEIDEVQITRAARSAGFLKLAAIAQGTSADAGKLLIVGNDESSAHEHEGAIMEHVNLIKDISKDLTFDGWVVIVLCFILAVVGWGIAIAKFFYLNKIQKATLVFRQRWKKIARDLTAIDHADKESVKTFGGTATGKSSKLMRHSPLYHIYHIGSEEIQARVESAKDGFKGLSTRSIQAIKATLHEGLLHEVQRLNGKLVFLTIGISGGPYLGLLGTVIGVMITFAVIAKSGQVEVNSIAPGIAGALLATVAGLAVAIPALFAYSYLSTRIKDVISDMEAFIDQFVAKMAEHYPETKD
ncbi:MAG: DUF2341 domain-containing protein [Verrucomicrobiaceae bacterium]